MPVGRHRKSNNEPRNQAGLFASVPNGLPSFLRTAAYRRLVSPGSSGIPDKRDAFTAARAVSRATPPSAVMRSAMMSGYFLHLYGQFAEEQMQ